MRLVRSEFKATGIFGELLHDDGSHFCFTIEHSFDKLPKLPDGTYQCVRGQHILHSGPIECFQIMNVPGHTNILIHPGNTQADSEGCVLVGTTRSGDTLYNSRDAFSKLMNQSDFTLLVSSKP